MDERLEGGWLVVGVLGDLDVYAAAELRAGFMESLARIAGHQGAGSRGADDHTRDSDGPVRGLVIDLSSVMFMDSAGLGLLVGLYKRAVADRTAFRLAGTTDQARRLFDVTGLSRVFAMDSSVDDAVLRPTDS